MAKYTLNNGESRVNDTMQGEMRFNGEMMVNKLLNDG